MRIWLTQAVARFGYGCGLAATAGADGAAPPDDPRSWLARQLDGADPAVFAGLPDTADGLIRLREQRRLKPPPGQSLVEPLFRAELVAQLDRVWRGDTPFRERLVWFWANHFTVSVRQNGVRPIVGAFVREAIRPHVDGRFADMLLAVMRHPAMLLYLDNAGSVGPDSPAGRRSHRGLNENLARECLELHTVSPAAGYTQADVTAFAAILTGWSVDMKADRPGFGFRPRAHEPGIKSLMGRDYPEGEAGGLLALDMLAHHPATYRHLATKLARHFLADDPTPAEIGHVGAALRDSGGDLKAASLALLDLPRAWVPGTKFRDGMSYAAAVLRALGPPPPTPAVDWRLAATGTGEAEVPAMAGGPRAGPDPGGASGAGGRPLFAAPAPGMGPSARPEPVGAVATTDGYVPDRPGTGGATRSYAQAGRGKRPGSPLAGAAAKLGQPTWSAPLPNGWTDEATGWNGPEAMMRRIDWCFAAAGHHPDLDPMEVAEASLGPLLSARTAAAMRGAGDRRDALTLLFSSPEFQMR
ncbi:DUF1800 family protein [Rhizosaccharibacter radicis]|uniref:DUF1800 family protein n=1 Tax=Rhizosaccharibacter radicis TaxID=2782605 RepID=A0ABT1VX64_9PROT|nr:DUF1800 family protein [Acetobacteraceae bacterium KSS12]